MRGAAARAAGDPVLPARGLGSDGAAARAAADLRPGAARAHADAGAQRRPSHRVGSGAADPRVGRPLPRREGASRARGGRIAAGAGGESSAGGGAGAAAAARRASRAGARRRGAAQGQGGVERGDDRGDRTARRGGGGGGGDREAVVRRGVAGGEGEWAGVLEAGVREGGAEGAGCGMRDAGCATADANALIACTADHAEPRSSAEDAEGTAERPDALRGEWADEGATSSSSWKARVQSLPPELQCPDSAAATPRDIAARARCYACVSVSVANVTPVSCSLSVQRRSRVAGCAIGGTCGPVAVAVEALAGDGRDLGCRRRVDGGARAAEGDASTRPHTAFSQRGRKSTCSRIRSVATSPGSTQLAVMPVPARRSASS